MATKLSLLLLLSFSIFSASAQTKSTASVQQGITFRLLPVSVIERVSTPSTEAGANANDKFLKTETKQQWAVQLKKMAALDEQSYALLSAKEKNNYAAENPVAAQLYTVSKP